MLSFYIHGIKGEVNDYFAKLRRMALTCEFENFLREAFCNCFMCRLLGEKFNADFFQKSTYIGVGGTLTSRLRHDHLLAGKKENLLQIVHEYVDNKFYNEPILVCVDFNTCQQFNNYTVSTITSTNVTWYVVTNMSH